MTGPLEIRDLSNLRLTVPVETKRAPLNGTVEGLGAVFGNVDAFGDIIRPGAFAKSLAAHRAEGTAPAMLWSHDPKEPIGKWTEVVETQAGLFVRGEVNLDTQRGREALALAKSGAVTGLSIGFQVMPGGSTYERNGTRNLTQVKLYEVSLVAMPANVRARIREAKSVCCRADLEDFLHEAGFPKALASKIAIKGWPRQGSEGFQVQLEKLAATVADATARLKGMNS